jgi:arsenate reductase (thioredoxin)
MSPKKRVLVLCTGNSCRSQMAEAWINHELGDAWEAHSAGTRPADRVHPLAVRAMGEVGIDIHAATPESVDRHLGQPWDLVVTVCDSARETCPVFRGRAESIHVSFPDPAEAVGGDDERMVVFRSVRDAIRARLLPELSRRPGRED